MATQESKATQAYPFDVYIKGPLTVGTNLAADQIKATLHLEQLPNESQDLAYLVSAENAGLKIHLSGGIPNLQGLTKADNPGDLALNRGGGNLQLGSATSEVSVPGNLTVKKRNILDELDHLQPNPDHLTVKESLTVKNRNILDELDRKLDSANSTVRGSLTVTESLTVNNHNILKELDSKLDSIPVPLDVKGDVLIAGTIKIGGKEVINAKGQWCGEKTNLQGPPGSGITAVRVSPLLDPDSEAKANLENIDGLGGDKRLVLQIPRGQAGQDGAPGTQIAQVEVVMLGPTARPTAELVPIAGDSVGKLLRMEIPRGEKGDTGGSGGGNLKALNDDTLWLRKSPDKNHGIGYFAKFVNKDVDGPVIFGATGGALGISRNGKMGVALSWKGEIDDQKQFTGKIKVGIGTTTPEETLHVIGRRIRLQADEEARAGKPLTACLDIRADGTTAFDIDSKDVPLCINNHAKAKGGQPVLIHQLDVVELHNLGEPQHASSRIIKENITHLTITEAVNLIDKLAPVRFNYCNDEQKANHLGFIAEDSPVDVTTDDRKAIYPTHIIAALSKVVKEQQRMLASLTAEIQRLHEQMLQPHGKPA